MKDVIELSKIVNFNQCLELFECLGGLLYLVCDMVSWCLQVLFGNMFEYVDDVLFDFVEKVENNVV